MIVKEASYPSLERRCLLQIITNGCPYRKPRQLTDARESVDSPIDERSWQIDLVRPDRAVPAAGKRPKTFSFAISSTCCSANPRSASPSATSTGYCLSGFIAWLPRCWTL
jgi:hypothetical protein